MPSWLACFSLHSCNFVPVAAAVLRFGGSSSSLLPERAAILYAAFHKQGLHTEILDTVCFLPRYREILQGLKRANIEAGTADLRPKFEIQLKSSLVLVGWCMLAGNACAEATSASQSTEGERILVGCWSGRSSAQQGRLAVLGAVEAMRLSSGPHPKGALPLMHPMLRATNMPEHDDRTPAKRMSLHAVMNSQCITCCSCV